MGWFLLPYQGLCLHPTCGRFWSNAVVGPGLLRWGMPSHVHEGCLSIPPWNSSLSFKVGQSCFKCPIPSHCQHWLGLYVLTAPCSCWGLLTVGWGVDLDWVWEARPLPQEPPLHVSWVFLPKPPLPKEGFPGLAILEEACVALTTDTKFFTCPTKASNCCCWYLSCLVSSSCLVGVLWLLPS